jgi:hypothetical protein
MRNFLRLAHGLDTRQHLLELARAPELWNQHRLRTGVPGSVNSEVDDILIRFPAADSEVSRAEDLSCCWYPALAALPSLQSVILDLGRKFQAYALDRVVISRLAPGKRIFPHADDYGAYGTDPERQRFHLVLQGLPGSIYRCGEETVTMLTGEVWWFNSRVEHEVLNNSSDDRLHLMTDFRTWPNANSPG